MFPLEADQNMPRLHLLVLVLVFVVVSLQRLFVNRRRLRCESATAYSSADTPAFNKLLPAVCLRGGVLKHVAQHPVGVAHGEPVNRA